MKKIFNFDNKKNRAIYILWLILILSVVTSCNEKKYEANISYQYIICDESNDPIKIKYVETFIVFKNLTNDTLKIPIKSITSNYYHVFSKDTLKISFEKIDSIFISPKDSLGLACASKINKTFTINDSIFSNGFNIYDKKSKRNIKKILRTKMQKREDFQIYNN